MIKSIFKELCYIEKLNINMYNNDFLLTSDKSKDDLLSILKIAEILKYYYENNISTKLFQTGLAISYFKTYSIKTKFAYSSAANLLGFALENFYENNSHQSHGETIKETANMISFMSAVVGIRDIYNHTFLENVSQSLDYGFKNNILPHRPSVINLQSDIDHPINSLAALLHLQNNFGGELENLKGKKIAVTWAYSSTNGKSSSVPQGLITLMSRFGLDIVLAHPDNFDLNEKSVKIAENNSVRNKSSFSIVNCMKSAFENADIVFPINWLPYNLMKNKLKLLNENNCGKADEIINDFFNKTLEYTDWECNQDKMKLTKNEKALYIHSLPADISNISCKNGEVSKNVFNRYKNSNYNMIKYKSFIIAAVIILTKFRDSTFLLDYLYRKRRYREIQT